MKELFGLTITDVFKNEDSTILVFSETRWGLNQNAHMYIAVGGCCSRSWFESINNIEALLWETIIGLEYKGPVKGIPTDEGDIIRVHGYTLKTEKGHCDIEFRNESNGYYDGWCEYRSVRVTKESGDEITVESNKKDDDDDYAGEWILKKCS
jgi:hypothetical protein